MSKDSLVGPPIDIVEATRRAQEAISKVNLKSERPQTFSITGLTEAEVNVIRDAVAFAGRVGTADREIVQSIRRKMGDE